MTQTPASGPAGPLTVPPMSSLSMATVEAVALGSPPLPPHAASNVARHETVNGRGMVRMLVPPKLWIGRKIAPAFAALPPSLAVAAQGSLEHPLSTPAQVMQARGWREFSGPAYPVAIRRSGGVAMVSRVFYGLLLACGIAAPAHAHHSFSAEFEADK